MSSDVPALCFSVHCPRPLSVLRHSLNVSRARPKVSSQALRRRRRAVARVDDAQGRDRARTRGARLPPLRPARRRQDDARARARDGAQLRATRRSGARRRAVRRVRVVPAHLERLGQPRRRRDRRGVEPRRRRRARAARARDVRAVRRRPLQGLHRRRSAHAHARGMERAAQDSRGAAAARRVRVRDDRAAEDRAVRRAGPEPAAAIRLQAHRPGRDSRPAVARAGARRRSPPSPRRWRRSRARPTARCATR